MGTPDLSSALSESGVVVREGLDRPVTLLRDGAIVYDTIEGLADLPSGWGDSQEAVMYRLRRRDDDALFGYAAASQSWKRFLHSPEQRLCRITREGAGQRRSARGRGSRRTIADR